MMARDLRIHVTLIYAAPERYQDDLRVLDLVHGGFSEKIKKD